MRDEFLNQHCNSCVRHARELGADWREDYNEVRPHTSLGGLAPLEFLIVSCPGHGPGKTPSTPTSLQFQSHQVRQCPEPLKLY